MTLAVALLIMLVVAAPPAHAGSGRALVHRGGTAKRGCVHWKAWVTKGGVQDFRMTLHKRVCWRRSRITKSRPRWVVPTGDWKWEGLVAKRNRIATKRGICSPSGGTATNCSWQAAKAAYRGHFSTQGPQGFDAHCYPAVWLTIHAWSPGHRGGRARYNADSGCD